MKATYCEVNGVGKEIFKDPKTVTGMPKKSHRGLLMVTKDTDGNTIVKCQVTKEQEASDENMLKTVFKDGKLTNPVTLADIRNVRKQSVIKLFNTEDVA